MSLKEKSDQEILEIADPLWDDLVKHSNAKDYWNFIKDSFYSLSNIIYVLITIENELGPS